MGRAWMKALRWDWAWCNLRNQYKDQVTQCNGLGEKEEVRDVDYGENSQPAMLRKTWTVLCSSQSLGASGIGSWLWLLPQSHIYAGVCRILCSYQASGWSLPYFTLILIKSTEVALQTSIINLNNLCSVRRKWLVLYAFWWCLWLPP